jgi:aldose 1-epimerase
MPMSSASARFSRPSGETREIMAVATPDPGLALETHELLNSQGDRVSLLSFGARVSGIDLELEDGPRRVTLGYSCLPDWVADRYFVGATIGRCSNRIRDARFELDGALHVLMPNEGAHQLHGGPAGFHRRNWRRNGNADPGQAAFSLVSPDGEQGYPGELEATVRYTWNDQRELTVSFSATTNRPTHVNLCNHSYFNLDGAGGDILEHDILIDAESITETDTEFLPTGALADITDTTLDLRNDTRISTLCNSDDPRIANAGGCDFNYVLPGWEGPVARLTSSRGDLVMTVATTCPGLQFYTGQHLGPPFRRFGGLCLETQYFPDTPNQPAFPSTQLVPGQVYTASTTYRFIAT